MSKEKRIPVERHDRLYRTLHWLIVGEMLLLLITGLAVSERVHLVWPPRGLARSIHVVVAFAWLGTITFFLYYFIYSGEYRWFGLRRLGEALDTMVEEIRALLRGEHLPEPIRYDPQNGEYVEKIYPTEVLAWWLWALVWTIMAITGLGLVFPEALGFVNRFWHAIVAGATRAPIATRTVHWVTALVIVAVVAIHAYLVIATGILKGMIYGKREEPVAEQRTQEELAVEHG